MRLLFVLLLASTAPAANPPDDLFSRLLHPLPVHELADHWGRGLLCLRGDALGDLPRVSAAGLAASGPAAADPRLVDIARAVSAVTGARCDVDVAWGARSVRLERGFALQLEGASAWGADAPLSRGDVAFSAAPVTASLDGAVALFRLAPLERAQTWAGALDRVVELHCAARVVPCAEAERAALQAAVDRRAGERELQAPWTADDARLRRLVAETLPGAPPVLPLEVWLRVDGFDWLGLGALDFGRDLYQRLPAKTRVQSPLPPSVAISVEQAVARGNARKDTPVHDFGFRFARADTDQKHVGHFPLPLDELAARMAAGYSLVVNSVQLMFPGVGALSLALARRLGNYVNVNLYATPPAGARALRMHYDCQEVFVLQLEGAKRWRVYSQLPGVGTPRMDSTESFDAGPPEGVDLLRELVMRPGDVLYVPAGCPHVAVSEDPVRRSTHLTFAVEIAPAATFEGVLHLAGLDHPGGVRSFVDQLSASSPALHRVVPRTPEVARGFEQPREHVAAELLREVAAAAPPALSRLFAEADVGLVLRELDALVTENLRTNEEEVLAVVDND